jgi:hypothetical protein
LVIIVMRMVMIHSTEILILCICDFLI